MYEGCLDRIYEQVVGKNSTICTHRYADSLLTNASTKHNKYVVNQTLEHIDDINFTIRAFQNSWLNTGFVTRVPHVEQELFAPSLTFLSGVRAHVVKLYMSSRFWLRIVMTFTISALKWCSIRPICFVGYMFYSCYLYLFPYIGFRHDVYIKWCSLSGTFLGGMHKTLKFWFQLMDLRSQ
jgi:hypothetical protein